MRRPSVSRMREIRTSGLTGGLRKRSQCATAPEAYQCAFDLEPPLKPFKARLADRAVGTSRMSCFSLSARLLILAGVILVLFGWRCLNYTKA